MDFFQDNLTLVLTVAFVLAVAQGMLAQALAEEKGHSKRWFWAGCLLPLVGVIWAAGLPDARLRAEVRELAQARRESAPPQTAAVEPARQEREYEDMGELAAAVTASLAAMGTDANMRPVLRSIRRAGGPTAWARAGERRRA